MTNNQLEKLADDYSYCWQTKDWEQYNGYMAGWGQLSTLITNHLKTLPLDTMTGKQVEESLWNEFLHIQ